MFEHDLLYRHSTVAIAVALFLLILLAHEAGYRFAHRVIDRSDEGIKSQTNAIQAGMLGLLALLLGFSFTMALQRFDSRSAATVEEANAIGTSYLRAGLLKDSDARAIRSLLGQYIEMRIAAGELKTTETAARKASIAETTAMHRQLWGLTEQMTRTQGRDPVTGLFIASLNELIDAYAKRQAALDKHVPEAVLFLLFMIFMIAGSILGYASGLGGRRPWLATVSMTGLIVLVIFIIIDLDRPRRGLIQVNQSSMRDLQLMLNPAPVQPHERRSE